MDLMQFAAIAVFAALAPGEAPTKPDTQTGIRLEVGRHYRVVVRETGDEEVVTTTYWATVKQDDGQSTVLADGEWMQHTGPAVPMVAPVGVLFINRVGSWVDRARGRKPLKARGFPMGNETVTLKMGQITAVSPISEEEFRELKESRRFSIPRPPHASE